ncbi:hypothetical protein LZ31DRAFT_235935 [Colletotrichum somersetense]|nr:hypothetical protein LZ31DRAFT_235935 [Colletotrichum somersetense]
MCRRAAGKVRRMETHGSQGIPSNPRSVERERPFITMTTWRDLPGLAFPYTAMIAGATRHSGKGDERVASVVGNMGGFKSAHDDERRSQPPISSSADMKYCTYRTVSYRTVPKGLAVSLCELKTRQVFFVPSPVDSFDSTDTGTYRICTDKEIIHCSGKVGIVSYLGR